MVKGDNVRLEDALQVELSQRGIQTAVWETPGLHIRFSEEEKKEIPDISTITKTFVMWRKENLYKLGFFVNDDHAGVFEERFTLEQLREKAPNLFEVEGTLIHL